MLLVFAGPNGAGKSTLRGATLSDIPIPFVNADEIAKWLFGAEAEARSYEAAEIAESIRRILFERQRSFSFETVLSDPVGEKVRFLAEAHDAGYFVAVHFIGLDSAATSRLRVADRVMQGGHDVPDDKLDTRYPRTLDNLARMLDVPDDLRIYDNSSANTPFRLIARLARGELLDIVHDIPTWAAFLDLPARVTPQTRFLP